MAFNYIFYRNVWCQCKGKPRILLGKTYIPHMYTTEHQLTKPLGNNTFSFHERKQHFGKAKIYIPSLKKIESIDEIQLWSHPVLEEIDHTGTLQSCSWLKHIYALESDTPTYIFDNHNHALYRWIHHTKHLPHDTDIELLHIDQHSDLNTPPHYLEKDQLWDIREYTNYTCQISTFITPFLHLYPDTNFTWIKSESQLLKHTWRFSQHSKHTFRIIDIDLDFRAPEMSIDKLPETYINTHNLIASADLVTIASSPMFLDQANALHILEYIFQWTTQRITD